MTDRPLKTTRPVAEVRTIEDVVAIERRPYDELVTARSLYDLFLATAQAVGERKALTVLRSENPADVGLSLTHRQLLAEVTRAANLFRGLGLAEGAGVAAFLTPTLPAMPALLLGAQVAGVACSLNYLLSREAIADLLRAQEATILVVPARALDEACWTKAAGLQAEVPSLRRVLVIGEEREGLPGALTLREALAGVGGEALAFRPTAARDTVCALFHTGGTTGRPKLVRLTHGNQIHAAFGFAQVFGYDERDVVIDGFPLFHVGGTMTTGLSVLAAGGQVVVPSPYALRPPAVVARYWDMVQAFRATVVSGVPTSIASLTDSWTCRADTASVRMAVTGGALLPGAVAERFEATTGIRLFQTYGMTEAAAAIAFNPGRGEPLVESVGFRAPYSEIRVLRLGQVPPEPCGPNESGLVQVRGPQVFPGYLDPAHDAGTLEAEGWLNTGDIGYLTEEERLVLTGREKDLIVRSGHNIDPAAIEEVADRFAGVRVSAAVGMPDQYAGEVPALFVVPLPGQAVDPAALKAHLDAELQEAPARPRIIKAIDALPVTAVGKIFKPALRDLAIAEKVRLEAERVCGPQAAVETEIALDERRSTLVTVRLRGADAARAAALEAALAPLPQAYRVHREGGGPADDAVGLELEGGIATLTLNRPGALNALSHEVMTALERRVGEIAGLPELRVVVLTGAGRAFSAGGDLIEFEAALAADGRRLLDLLRYNQDVFQLVEDLPVPVIGVANGLAVAGGLELLLCCDLLLAAEGAKIGDGHTRYGVVPAGGGTVRLTERLAPALAAQLFYTAELVEAETLARWGLVNEVLPAARLMERARELAREIAARSPEAVRHTKALTGRLARPPERARRIRAELERFAEHLEGQDLARGLAAFRSKTPPRY